MYGSVLDAEGSRIDIGECSIVCENAVLRATALGDREYPVIIGDHVFISPQSTLIGCSIESYSYIATGVTILQGAIIESGAAVAVGAFVHANTRVPNNSFIPPNSIAIGDPIRLFSPDQKEELAKAIKDIEFAKVAFNIDAKWENRQQRYEQATRVRSKEFESHFNDEILG
ncbi:MAG: gamma carbonic anhydrase family protein [Candidatus Hodarchaeota archaeon]